MPDEEDKVPMIPQALNHYNAEIEELTVGWPLEAVMSLHDQLKNYAKAVKYLQQQLELCMIDWIKANGDIVIGDVRYYVGVTKKTKPLVDAATIIDEVARICYDGDVSTAGDIILSANWCKHGTVRNLLPDKFDEWFETTEVPDLKTGKPKRGLKRIDAKYL